MIIAVDNGMFELWHNRTLLGKCELNADALAKLFLQVKLYALSDIIASSTVDFPEEYGAPEGFDARRVIHEATLIRWPI